MDEAIASPERKTPTTGDRPWPHVKVWLVPALVVTVVVGHLILRLPFLQYTAWLFLFLLVSGVVFLASLSGPWRGILLLLPLALFPLAGTLALGYVRFASIKTAGAPDPEPIANSSSVRDPLVVHISDTHFLGKALAKTREGDRRDVAVTARLIQTILTIHPEYVVVSGDITDTGSEAQWEQAKTILLEPMRAAGIKLVLSPGNHDLQPAFGGASESGGVEMQSATLVRRFMEAQSTALEDWRTAKDTFLRSEVQWAPTDREVEDAARQGYIDCMAGYPGLGQQGSPRAWAKGCEIATKPERVREGMLARRTVGACSDWFPISRHDLASGISTIVLCSSATSTSAIGSNALGSFGRAQPKKLAEQLASLPRETRTVLIVLHHPLLREWKDAYAPPEKWWSWSEWNNGAIFNYALMGAEWDESIKIVDSIVDRAQSRADVGIVVLFGHRHVKSYNSTGGRGWLVDLVEAPAFGSPRGEPGLHIGRRAEASGTIKWEWLPLDRQ